MNRIIYDVDNTLTANIPDCSYQDKPVSSFFLESGIQPRKDFGVAYYTARNMKSFNEDLDKINDVTKPIMQEWLINNGFPNANLYLGKPYCGEKGVYVDDRAVNIRNHKFAVNSGLLDKHIYVVVTLYNAIHCIEDIVLQLIELATLCLNLKVLLVDNNSSDGTVDYIKKVSSAYPFLDVLELKNNVGYGGAVLRALPFYTAACEDEEYSLVVAHGNSKYSILDFLKGIAQNGFVSDLCFTKRVNRAFSEYVTTYSLYLIYFLTMRLEIVDCIGACRYTPHSKIKDLNFSNAPTDYRFDIWLSIQLSKEKKCSISLPQTNFITHRSTWNKSYLLRLKMIFSYIKLIFIHK